MRRALRENLPWTAAALLGVALSAWLSLTSYVWTDYESEAAPAVRALVRGDLHAFLSLSPAYGGSLVERAPFALVPGLWGGGQLAVYRMLALPGLAALVWLALWAIRRLRAAEVAAPVRFAAVAVCVLNPIAMLALEYGHAEELLCGCLCIGAVLLAASREVRSRRAILVGVVLGLAVADKDWAALAAGPILLALPPSMRLRAAASAVAATTLVLAPLLLGSSGSFLASTAAIGSGPSPIFEPWQVWWFLGHHGLVVGSSGVAKVGYRVGPSWAQAHSHLVILLFGLALAGALWAQLHRRGTGARLSERHALAALALVLLARCMLDTWDFTYYALPFVLATLAWEIASERPPVLAMTATLAVWFDFEWLPGRASPDALAAVYLVWSLPLAAWLARGAFARSGVALGRRSAEPRAALVAPAPLNRLPGEPAQETTVRSLESPVRTSRPPSRTTVRSSIRTPSTPGR